MLLYADSLEDAERLVQSYNEQEYIIRIKHKKSGFVDFRLMSFVSNVGGEKLFVKDEYWYIIVPSSKESYANLLLEHADEIKCPNVIDYFDTRVVIIRSNKYSGESASLYIATSEDTSNSRLVKDYAYLNSNDLKGSDIEYIEFDRESSLLYGDYLFTKDKASLVYLEMCKDASFEFSTAKKHLEKYSTIIPYLYCNVGLSYQIVDYLYKLNKFDIIKIGRLYVIITGNNYTIFTNMSEREVEEFLFRQPWDEYTHKIVCNPENVSFKDIKSF